MGSICIMTSIRSILLGDIRKLGKDYYKESKCKRHIHIHERLYLSTTLKSLPGIWISTPVLIKMTPVVPSQESGSNSVLTNVMRSMSRQSSGQKVLCKLKVDVNFEVCEMISLQTGKILHVECIAAFFLGDFRVRLLRYTYLPLP